MIALVAVVAASPFFYRRIFYRVEEEIRARVEATIAARFPHLEVQVRAAHVMGEGIEVRGLSIAEPDAAGPQPQLAYFDEVFLECQTSVQELVAGEPEITRVKLSRPVIRATRRPDGTFSLAKLLPLPKPKRPPPPTSIEAGVIEIFDPLKNPSSTLTLRDVNFSITPTTKSASGGTQLDVKGYLLADQMQRMEIAGTLDPSAQRWTMNGTVDGLEISPELLSALPQQASDPLAPLAYVRAPASFSFRVSSDPSDRMLQFEVNAVVTHGRIEHPQLPFPLVDLAATIHLDNTGLRVLSAKANHGSTEWQVTEFDRRGYQRDSPFVLRARGRQVRFDRGWGNSLTEPWRTHWAHYDPEGEVDVDCTLFFDGAKLKPTVHVTCRDNVSFSYHKFPYRLESSKGTVALVNNELTLDLTAYSGAQPVSIVGKCINPGPNFSGEVKIHGEKIQFDEKLFGALLRPKANETLRSLNPREGSFDVQARIWRDANDSLPAGQTHQLFTVTVNRCSMTYDKFPYPLSNVQGVLEMRDGVWTFPNLVGTNGTGTVTCNGTLAAAPGAPSELKLQLHGDNISLEKELRDALPANRHDVWDTLQPYGNVNLDAKVTHVAGTPKPEIEVWVRPRGDDTSLRTSIQPMAFPYRMEILEGSVHYRNGHIELHDLHAVHRNTDIRAGGVCELVAERGWRLDLQSFAAHRVHLQGEDPELIAALPRPLRRAVAELHPTGPINIKGSLEFAKRSPQEPLHAGWNVDLFLNRASVQVGPRVDNVFGAVWLKGTSDGGRLASQGQLKLDSLTYKNLQFTQITGPFWFDNENVYIGAWPRPPGLGGAPARITARIFDGTAAADCHVKLGTVPEYHLLASLTGADLAQFARENLASHQRLAGRVLANVDLRGSRGAHSLSGSGNIHLSDADVYELPVMVALLKIVRAKPPDATAFTQSDIGFEVNGEHVALRRIELKGDAVDLSGQGELTLDGQTNPIQLELHTKVGRGALPIISGVFSEASQQIMKIHVSGSLDHPQTYTEAFPVANQALERLRADYTAPTAGAMNPPQRR